MATAIGAAARFVAKEFGGAFRVRQEVVTVGTASIVAAPNDPDRVALILVNLGATTITISFQPAAVAGQGILLLDNGSDYSVNVRDDAIIPAWQHTVVSSAVGGSLLVVELALVNPLEERQP